MIARVAGLFADRLHSEPSYARREHAPTLRRTLRMSVTRRGCYSSPATQSDHRRFRPMTMHLRAASAISGGRKTSAPGRPLNGSTLRIPRCRLWPRRSATPWTRGSPRCDPGWLGCPTVGSLAAPTRGEVPLDGPHPLRDVQGRFEALGTGFGKRRSFVYGCATSSQGRLHLPE